MRKPSVILAGTVACRRLLHEALHGRRMVQAESCGQMIALPQFADGTEHVTNAVDPGRHGVAVEIAARHDVSTALSNIIVQKNVRIQYLRGIAAVAVLFFHCADYLHQLRDDSRFLAVFNSFIGMYGVAIFFVISGYLMSRLSRQGNAHRFIVDRILRIYPLMFAVIAVAGVAYVFSGHARRPDLLSLTLFPTGHRSYFLGVEWTLIVEVTFYVIIAVAMLAGKRRLLEAFFAFWLITLALFVITGSAPAPDLTPTLTEFLGQSANSAFLLGFLLPCILDAKLMPRPTGLLVIATAVALLAAVFPDEGDRWVAGISSMMVVAAALKAQPATDYGLFSRMGLRLGDASYALYLCHVPVIVISGNLLPETVTGGSLWFGWAVSAIAIALAIAPVDLQMHQRLKIWANSLSQRSLAVMAAGFIAAFVGIATFAEFDARAGAKARADALRALQTPQIHYWPEALVGIDSSAVLKGGRVVIRGFAIDLARPDGGAHVAIFQNGAIIGFDRMTRMRPKIAESSLRPDIASIRFGFGVVTDGPLNCAAGSLSAKVVFSSDKIALIESDILNALCGGK